MSYENQIKLKLFKFKNDYLQQNEKIKYTPINLEQFYRIVFERDGKLPFQKFGEQEYRNLKYNAIAVCLDKDNKASNFIVNDDLKVLDKIRGQKFVISSPITYVGRNRNSNNARFIYGYSFDIDGVGQKEIVNIIHQMNTGFLPTANVIVNSGNGVHLYYLFEYPIPLFQNNKRILKKLKYRLTDLLWNKYTSNVKSKQFQGIFQGFRLPETQTKSGELVRAFKTEAHYHTIEKLNNYVNYQNNGLSKIEIENIEKTIRKQSKVSLNQAQELYPKWYELRIVKSQKKGSWINNSKLYDWWLNKVLTDEKVSAGHRYFCVMMLAIYAIKCNISFEKLEYDAINILLPKLESLTASEDNHFTQNDIDDALLAFKENYRTFPRRDMEMLSGLSIPKNKRNGQTQKNHLEEARAIRDIRQKRKDTKWDANKGRKTKQEQVLEWKINNPSGTKYQCQKDLKFDKKTIRKWWNS